MLWIFNLLQEICDYGMQKFRKRNLTCQKMNDKCTHIFYNDALSIWSYDNLIQ